MTAKGTIKPPVHINPPENWVYLRLYEGAKEALETLPIHFKTDTVISGINATDLFTLGAALGATIEDQIVQNLNNLRNIWDPEDLYSDFVFIRQPQTFPDVLLTKPGRADIVLGLEIKGWYLLAKEGEPSFRYEVTTEACNPQDLIVVVPWALNNVISGTPKVFTPFVESARYAALYRNYHWQYVREAKSDNRLLFPEEVKPYPKKTDSIKDRPVSDTGGNFGRFARTGIMDEYLAQISTQLLCGIQARFWREFFELFQEHYEEKAIQTGIGRIMKKIESCTPADSPDYLERATALITELIDLVRYRN